jgi:uncharacterized protein involved in type VI secretion and phage assembly
VSAQTIVRTFRDIAEREIASRPSAGIGEVTSIGSGEDIYACSVKIRETGLVLPSVPIAVGGLGHVGTPAVGDLVVVVFVAGDLHAPVIVGRLYDDETGPPKHEPGEVVLSLPPGPAESDSALDVRLKAGDGERSLAVTLDGSEKVEVKIVDDSVSIVVGEAKVDVETGSIGLEVGDAKLVLKKNGDVSIEGGKLSLKATQIEIDGDASVKIAGQTIDLN